MIKSFNNRLIVYVDMCVEVAILFLMLVFMTIRVLEGELDDLRAKLSSWWIYDLKFWSLYLLNKWKEKWLEKISMILLPGENSGLRGSNEGNTLLKQLSMSTKWPLISLY